METLFKMNKKLCDLCISGGGLKTPFARMKITFQKGRKLEKSFVFVRVVKNQLSFFLSVVKTA